MKQSHILLGITGSIAAYKVIDLAKLLLKKSYTIDIVLTDSAANFISPLTLRSLFPHSVYLYDDLLNEQDNMLHIELAKKASLFVIAPCSANMISSLSVGRADCLLSTIALATDAKIAIAPAMNKLMWDNTIVQSNIRKLIEHNILVWGPAVGEQACGDNGYGRMLEPADIVEKIEALAVEPILCNKKVVITAGPTIEPLDPVRFISNHSSGKMGYEIAKAARDMGANVVLISGPTNLEAPAGIEMIYTTDALSMLESAMISCIDADIFIASAAVADYSPINYSEHKIKKTSEDNISITLKKNPDIISIIKQKLPDLFCLGFAAETQDHDSNAYKKLLHKNIDMIAVNDFKSAVRGDYNQLYLIDKANQFFTIEKAPKKNVAISLLHHVLKYISPLS